jgi:Fe-S cluster biogenesis protein NfuA
MIDEPALTSALEEVQEIIRADGGDLHLVGVDGGTARLRLVVETAACVECVLPRSMLEQVALKMMKPSVPGLTGVEVDDPRESPDFTVPSP